MHCDILVKTRQFLQLQCDVFISVESLCHLYIVNCELFFCTYAERSLNQYWYTTVHQTWVHNSTSIIPKIQHTIEKLSQWKKMIRIPLTTNSIIRWESIFSVVSQYYTHTRVIYGNALHTTVWFFHKRKSFPLTFSLFSISVEMRSLTHKHQLRVVCRCFVVTLNVLWDLI